MANSTLTTTIQAGRFKGQKIDLPSLESTRSTKAILKGSLFDSVQNEIVGLGFVELFGGSGSMGLEALSRGAEHAYFIEKDRKAFLTLQANCRRIAPHQTTVVLGDTFTTWPTILPHIKGKTLFYADPPFSIRNGMEQIYAQTLLLLASLPPSIVYGVVIEHMSDVELPLMIGPFTQTKSRRFGKSTLSHYM